MSLKWLCGLDITNDEEEELKIDQRKTLASLKQKRWEKIVLNINFIVVVIVGIGLFVFFTLNPFPSNFEFDLFNKTK